jgi:hypothetical protein
MNKLDLGDLSINVDGSESGKIRLQWQGASNSKDPGSGLRPFFAILASRARDQNAVLEQHFEDLRYLNSSTIAVLVEFMRDGQTRGLKQRYVYDASLRWQAASFEALETTSRGSQWIEFVALRRGEPPLERGGV